MSPWLRRWEGWKNDLGISGCRLQLHSQTHSSPSIPISLAMHAQVWPVRILLFCSLYACLLYRNSYFSTSTAKRSLFIFAIILRHFRQNLISKWHHLLQTTLGKRKEHKDGPFYGLIRWSLANLIHFLLAQQVLNYHYNSPSICANYHWHSERRELFARTISANVHIRVSVNVQAKTTPWTFTRIIRVSVKQALDTS